MNNHEYAGFWIRVVATIIDTIIVLMILGPVLTMIYGQEYWMGESFSHGSLDLLLNYVLPAIAVIIFWIYKSATPGKMICNLIIVDAKTGNKPTTSQFVIRYVGYYISTIPLLLGLIWVAFDGRKQGWHDKIAGTLVVKTK